MPTILKILGWRLFFYANEGNEPIHVHCRKGDKECKFWLDRENFDLIESFIYNLNGKVIREIKKSFLTILNILSNNGKIFKGGKAMVERYKIRDLHFKENNLIININGDVNSFSLNKISLSLLNATEIERNTFEISPSGYGIHWPLLDEDLSIDGLMGVEHKFNKKLRSA